MAKMFYAGELRDAKSGEVTEIRNPATGEVVDTVPKGNAEDVRSAVEAADKALGVWSRMAPSKRGELLHEAVRLIRENEKELSALLTKEQGKPIRESVLEIRRFAHTLEHYAGMAKTMRGGYVTLDDGRYGFILRKPMGVVGAIVPWNFPVSLMGNKVGPALLGVDIISKSKNVLLVSIVILHSNLKREIIAFFFKVNDFMKRGFIGI